jgi:hypothetical protein
MTFQLVGEIGGTLYFIRVIVHWVMLLRHYLLHKPYQNMPGMPVAMNPPKEKENNDKERPN